MKLSVKAVEKKVSDLSLKVSAATIVTVERNGSVLLFAAGVCLLFTGLSDLSAAASTGSTTFNDDEIKKAICNILQLIEGSYGALLMVTAALGAIVQAALGAYKGAMNCLVIACGGMITRSVTSLYFTSTPMSSCSTSYNSSVKVP